MFAGRETDLRGIVQGPFCALRDAMRMGYAFANRMPPEFLGFGMGPGWAQRKLREECTMEVPSL